MNYRLRAGLHLCILGDHAFFLDTAAGRYFAAAGHLSAILIALVASGGSDEDGQLDVGSLVSCGLIEGARGDEPFAPSRRVDPVDEAHCSTGVRISWHGVATAAIQQLKARAMTTRITFADILTVIEQRGRGGVQRAGEHRFSLDELAAAHAKAGLFLGHADRCLPRSLALLLAAYADGHHPDFVIGVRNHPFAAHCWVQAKGKVLNDNLDHARLFTPILVQ